MSYLQSTLRIKSSTESMLFEALNYTFLSKPIKSVKERTCVRLDKTILIQIAIIIIVKFK
mgnify:CR=1 FL=1